jgi:hypothetical protein
MPLLKYNRISTIPNIFLNKIKIKTKSNNNWDVRNSFQCLVYNANNNIISFSNRLEAQAVYWILFHDPGQHA